MKHRKRVRKATVNYCKMCKIIYHTIFTIIEQVAQPKAATHTHTHTLRQTQTHCRACDRVLGSIEWEWNVEIGTTRI